MEIDVSIIIPMYNAEAYLEQCLESVAAQTLQGKEVLCVDDGSQDGTWDILQAYQKRYDWIRIWRQENAGAGPARNFALEQATGRYVTFLDSDDWYLDSKSLEVLVREADSHQCKAAAGLRKVFGANGVSNRPMFRGLPIAPGESMVVPYRDYQMDTDYHQYIFSRQMLDEHNIRFPNLRRGQDLPFNFRALLTASNICVCHVEFYAYRVEHHDNAREIIGKMNLFLKANEENMRLAKKENCKMLQTRIIQRVNSGCGEGIRNHFNLEILRELLAIEDDRIVDETMPILNDCVQAGKGELAFLRKFVYLLQMKVDFSAFLKERGIHRIAIYGLAKFGEMFYRAIKDSDLDVVAAIDNYKPGAWHGIPIIRERDLPQDSAVADAIVVCILTDGDIVYNLRKTRSEKILSFRELVNGVHALVAMEEKTASRNLWGE